MVCFFFSALYFETGSLIELSTYGWVDCLARKPQESILHVSVETLQVHAAPVGNFCCCCLVFLKLDSGDLDQVTEPFPQHFFEILCVCYFDKSWQ